MNVLEVMIYFNIPCNGSDEDESRALVSLFFGFFFSFFSTALSFTFKANRAQWLIVKCFCLDWEIEINERLQVWKMYSFWLPFDSCDGYCPAILHPFTKLSQPRSPFLSPCLSFFNHHNHFFGLSLVDSPWNLLAANLAIDPPPTPLSIYWNIIQLRDVASMKGTYVLKINLFLIGVLFFVFFQKCCFALCFPYPSSMVGPRAPALLLMLYNLKNYAWLNKCQGPCLYYVQVQLGTALSMYSGV